MKRPVANKSLASRCYVCNAEIAVGEDKIVVKGLDYHPPCFQKANPAKVSAKSEKDCFFSHSSISADCGCCSHQFDVRDLCHDYRRRSRESHCWRTRASSKLLGVFDLCSVFFGCFLLFQVRSNGEKLPEESLTTAEYCPQCDKLIEPEQEKHVINGKEWHLRCFREIQARARADLKGAAGADGDKKKKKKKKPQEKDVKKR